MMTSTWVLSQLGIAPKVGEEITLTYTNPAGSHTATFILSGYYESYLHIRSENQDYILLSQFFAQENQADMQRDAALSIMYQDAERFRRLTRC